MLNVSRRKQLICHWSLDTWVWSNMLGLARSQPRQQHDLSYILRPQTRHVSQVWQCCTMLKDQRTSWDHKDQKDLHWREVLRFLLTKLPIGGILGGNTLLKDLSIIQHHTYNIKIGCALSEFWQFSKYCTTLLSNIAYTSASDWTCLGRAPSSAWCIDISRHFKIS